MDARDKAYELVEKFTPHAYFNAYGNGMVQSYEQEENAKKCAIIAVELKLTPLQIEFIGNVTTYIISYQEINYWQEVKRIIEEG